MASASVGNIVGSSPILAEVASNGVITCHWTSSASSSARLFAGKALPLSAEGSHSCRHGRSSGKRPCAGARASVIEQSEIADKWWEKNLPANMKDLHSTQEFVAALGDAGEKLVVVEFFGTWCGSCRALFPKLCKLAAEYPDVLFYKIQFDENKALCKSLNIRVLPFFHFYRGASGRLDAFPASLSKLQRLKDALAQHSTDRCSLGPPAGPEQVLHPDLVPEAAVGPAPPVTR